MNNFNKEQKLLKQRSSKYELRDMNQNLNEKVTEFLEVLEYDNV